MAPVDIITKGESMKNTLLFLGLIVGFLTTESAFASRENISVTVNGKVYQCSGSGGATECDSAANGFRSQLFYCYKDSSGKYCAETFWPKFKAAHPNCLYAGMEPCLEYCYKTASGKACTELCS